MVGREKEGKWDYKPKKPNSNRLYMVVALIVLGIQVLMAWVDSVGVGSELSFYRFQELAIEGRVSDVRLSIAGDTVSFEYEDEDTGRVKTATAWNPRTEGARDFIAGLDSVNVSVYTTKFTQSVRDIIVRFPIIVLIVVISLRMAKSISNGMDDVSQIISVKDIVGFDGIIGLSEVKRELQKVIVFLKNPELARAEGARPITGMVLHGAPGVGKTMLAKAVAKESGLRLITATGSDFNSMWAGIGGIKIKALFRLARFNAPCVLFIDEIEGLVAKRDFKGGEVSKDNAKTLNALLAEMDGLNNSKGVFVIGATNHFEILDPAVLRGGRLERQVMVSHSGSIEETKEVVEFYMDPKLVREFSKGNDVQVVSDHMELINSTAVLLQGRSPAEIANIVNLAVYERLEDGESGLDIKHLDRALSKVLTGGYPRRHEFDEDLQRTAVHEAGHVVMALLQGKTVLKATVLRHGDMGGYVLVAPPKHSFETLQELKDKVKFLLAGMVAEEIVLGEASTGYVDDMDKASKMIEMYVDRLGMGARMVVREKPDDTYDIKDRELVAIMSKIYIELSNNRFLLDAITSRMVNDGTIYNKDLMDFGSLLPRGKVFKCTEDRGYYLESKKWRGE
jgi:cell division protease FtsH